MTSQKNKISGSDWWVNSEELSFSDIVVESRVPHKWSRYDLVQELSKDLFIKPINKYVYSLYPRPDLVSIKDGVAHFRQKTHAEIWVKPDNTQCLYALDKTWQRQFYPSKNKWKDPECFEATYRFYIPWIVGKNCDILIKNFSYDGDVFSVKSSVISNVLPEKPEMFYNTNFVDFKIKKIGKHMVGDKYGIIDIGTPMYDFFVNITEEETEKVIKQYE
jgi:hypothetical protein